MKVGDVYYRKTDGQECKIVGFFFIHGDGTHSLIYENLSYLKQLMYEIDKYKQYYVLFGNGTFDTVENVFTSFYMLQYEYKNWKQVYQEILDTQSVEAFWDDNDLVPNPSPGESKRKRFKLW